MKRVLLSGALAIALATTVNASDFIIEGGFGLGGGSGTTKISGSVNYGYGFVVNIDETETISESLTKSYFRAGYNTLEDSFGDLIFGIGLASTPFDDGSFATYSLYATQMLSKYDYQIQNYVTLTPFTSLEFGFNAGLYDFTSIGGNIEVASGIYSNLQVGVYATAKEALKIPASIAEKFKLSASLGLVSNYLGADAEFSDNTYNYIIGIEQEFGGMVFNTSVSYQY